MKKILLLLALICLVLAVGPAFGAENWAGDRDSLIYTLDPENAPAPIIPHTGLMGLTEEGLTGARGSAAGGRSETRDSLVNYLDPSYEPAERIPKRLNTGVSHFDPESMISQISPID